jgi:hypothetical protein
LFLRTLLCHSSAMGDALNGHAMVRR